MNALGRTTSTMLPRVTRQVTGIQARSASSGASFRQIWLSDVSTYPIISILGVAIVGCSYFMANKMLTDPAIRISKKHKGQVIRNHLN